MKQITQPAFKSTLRHKKQFLLCLVAVFATFALQAQTIRYVKQTATGTGDGSSWANASANLQAMINASAVNDQVWVAAGTYKPTNKPYDSGTEISTTDNRDKTFHVKDGVKIYGGFSASAPEATLAARNISTNITILSGDIGTANVATDNCYHVVIASAASTGGIGVTIDGFSITGGNANGGSSSNIYVNGNAIYLSQGGAINLRGGTNTLINNTIYSNSANRGGGIYSEYGTNTLTNNTIYSNSASQYGGGICTDDGTNTLANNTIYSNSVSGDGLGGGISILSGKNVLSNNTLYSNTASSVGGGIYALGGANVLSNNTLYSNTASSVGGGIYTTYGTNTLNNNIFWANKKGTADNVVGADYYVEGGTNTFKNNLLQLASSNYTSANKNALGTAANGNIFAQNPNFVNTSNIVGADGKHRTADDGLQLSGCSLALDEGLSSDGTPNTIPSTDIVGTAIYNGNKDIGAYERNSSSNNPTKFMVTGSGNFCTAMSRVVGLTGSEIGVTYQLKDNAGTNVGTAINGTGAAISFSGNQAAGTYTVVATRTAASCSRSMEGSAVVRIFPVCCPSTSTLHVNAAVVGGTGDGSSWANAYSNLSDALRVTYFCPMTKMIKVAAGTYKPSRKPFDNLAEMTTTDNRDMTFHIPDGVTVEGGYDAVTGIRTITANETILSGDIGTANVNTDNSYHVVLTSANSTTGIGVMIDGCSITGGNANGSSTSTITVNSNVIAKNDGAGIIAYYGTNMLSNNIIYNNGTLVNNYESSGGGIYTYYGTNTLSNNIIYNNTSSEGGGIYTYYGTNTLNNNTVYNNSEGIYTYSGTNTLSNNIFWSNPIEYYAKGTYNNIFKNNLLQKAESNYSDDYGSYNRLATGSSDNLFAQKPAFVNAANPAGADGKHRTADDGL